MPLHLTAAPGRVGSLTERILDRAGAGEARVLIGIIGAPGAGKSTLTDALQEALAAHKVTSAVVGMDGFHLAQAELDRLGRADRKGAIDTFDAAGYVALLRRLRDQRPGDEMIYAPRYVRGAIEESIGSAVPVSGEVRVVLTEGNYLLAESPPWNEIARIVDETWFLATDPVGRRERLLARHLANGKTMERALAFTDGSDARNADFIESTAARADVQVTWQER
ncbi:nucleoside/nucleotide kinase family protein [Ruania halotolerans]|uniref:nucleoside/nucleotide kinase family protein n=1 Tax=Ruania halotolerans TaxID=2897773 RepID=UPI001E352B38|nr:nucleoside/nucleotide kinase family protein [Ruania halotolerans]UFU05095.1 nucleoside/nucleotide kinase family protein [Ruania halotolerans]